MPKKSTTVAREKSCGNVEIHIKRGRKPHGQIAVVVAA